MPLISEPTTMLTDYALAVAGWVLAMSLPRIKGVNTLTATLWSLGFISIGTAGLAGGTFHGFRDHFDVQTLQRIWNTTIFLIGTSVAFMVAGVMASSNSRYDESTKWLLAGVLVTLAGLAAQQSTLSFAGQFNHNDIFHCVQIGGLILLFLGARRLQDRKR